MTLNEVDPNEFFKIEMVKKDGGKMKNDIKNNQMAVKICQKVHKFKQFERSKRSFHEQKTNG